MGKQITVMVTGVGGGGHGAQILKALKMSELNYKIVGCDITPYSSGLQEVDYPYVVPLAKDIAYIDTILDICEKHDVKMLFHGSESELLTMANERFWIEREGIILPINSDETIKTCMHKFETISFLRKNGFPHLSSVLVSDSDDIEIVFGMLPVVLKPSFNSGGSKNVLLVQTFQELAAFAMSFDSYPIMIAQEYIGTSNDEYTVGILCDMDGNLINSIAVKRDINSSMSRRLKIDNQYVISSGISQGRIGRFPEVTETCEQIALKLGCRGAMNLQCRLVDGKVYVFEINPRFSGTTSLRAMVGYNEPDILIRKHILGEDIEPHFAYKEGYIARSLKETFIGDPDAITNYKTLS